LTKPKINEKGKTTKQKQKRGRSFEFFLFGLLWVGKRNGIGGFQLGYQLIFWMIVQYKLKSFTGELLTLLRTDVT